MPDYLLLIIPIFLLIAAGFLSVRAGLATPAQIDGLAMFVLNFALPALILNALLRQDLRQTFNASYILAYAGGSLVAFIAVLAALRLALARPLARAAIGGLGGAASNTGFIGFPVASLAIGAPALTVLPLTMLVENFLVIPLALAIAEAGGHGGASLRHTFIRTMRRLSRMPIIMAIVLGAILSYFGLHLPAPVATAVEMTAKASAPLALFVVGGTIAGLRVAAVAGDLVWIVAGKLLVHPLAVAACLFMIGGVPPELRATGIIFASVPMFTVYPILARHFAMDGVAAAALIVATAAGFVTITAVLAMVLGG